MRLLIKHLFLKKFLLQAVDLMASSLCHSLEQLDLTAAGHKQNTFKIAGYTYDNTGDKSTCTNCLGLPSHESNVREK